MESTSTWLVSCITSTWGIVLISSIVLCFFYWYFTKTRRMLEATFPKIPGPKPWPLIGNMPAFMRDGGQFHLHLDRLYKTYGSLFSTSFFDSPVLVVSDPKMIKEIWVKKFDSFHDRPAFLFSLPYPINTSLDVSVGETWHRIRTALSPSFSAHKLKVMTPLMNVACDTLLKKLEEAAESGRTFDMVKSQQALTLDVIMSAAYGIQTDFQNNPDDPIMKKALAAMNPSALSQFLTFVVLPMMPFGSQIMGTETGSKFIFKDFIAMVDVAEEVVNIKRKEGSNRQDFLDMMLNASKPETPEHKRLKDEEVLVQCLLFLLAGYETSSTTLSMTCYNLATNPEIQEKLQEEIDTVWEDPEKMPSYETVHSLPYLEKVLSETLRLCPPGNMLMRECTKECVIEDLKIPKGCVVTVPVYSIHRDPNIYPDPEKFDPERFDPEAKQSRDPYYYLPFGTGPRNCIGMRFAQMEIKLVLARLLKKFTFVSTPETQIPPKLESKPTLAPVGGIKLGVKLRNL